MSTSTVILMLPVRTNSFKELEYCLTVRYLLYMYLHEQLRKGISDDHPNIYSANDAIVADRVHDTLFFSFVFFARWVVL